MNTTERIVESYFRICRNCFTMSDVKVHRGNNRQLDLLAACVKSQEYYHVEIGVTHMRTFQPVPTKLEKKIQHKFFGEPRVIEKRRRRPKTAPTPKNYFKAILDTYHRVGFDTSKLKRIWVTWEEPLGRSLPQRIAKYCLENELPEYCVEFLSFRDHILPQLMKEVGTANYSDDALRTLSLLRQRDRQARISQQKTRQTRIATARKRRPATKATRVQKDRQAKMDD
jgi:hypothetical protein